jgi:hypothetical protein
MSPVPRHAPLAAILLLAAILRVWGIGFGLPHTWARPDEDAVMIPAVRVVQGDLNPHWFQYPSAYMYALAPLYAAYYVEQRVRGGIESRSDLLDLYFRFPDSFHLLDRWLAATLGVLTVLALYAAARLLVTETAALLSAFFLAVAPLHVRDSHFGVADVPATCMIVAAFWAIARWSASPSSARLVCAGALCGLAASTKYNAAIVILPAVLALLMRARDERLPASAIVRSGTLLCGSAIAAFIAGTPYALLDVREFVNGVGAVGQHLAGGHGRDLGLGWIHHLRVTLVEGLGLPLLVAALGGMLWMFRAAPRTAALVFSFPLAYYAAAGSTRTVFFRYMIPVLPFLALGAAWAVDRAAAAWSPRVRPAWFSAAVAAVLVVVPAIDVVQMNLRLQRTDSRVLAADWMRDHVPAGLTVYQSGAFYGHLQFGRPPRFREAALGSGESFTVNGTPLAGPPDLLVVQSSPLMYSDDVPLIARMAARGYEQIAEIRACDLSQASANVYDPLDAFYLPLRGMRGVERPGPNIAIYRRRAESR